MKSRIDPDTIAKTGTREERSGKFIAPKIKECLRSETQ